MLTARELPFEEWDRLEGTELGPVRQFLVPSMARILVVEDENGAILGCWSMLTVRHLEGFWKHPASGPGVLRLLLKTMHQWIEQDEEACGPSVMTAAADESMSRYLERLGAEELGTKSYIWNMGES